MVAPQSDAVPHRDTYESGNEPEFIINDMPRWEDAGDGLIRVFVSSRRGRTDRIEYSFVCTADGLAFMCRKGLMFAAEAHNHAISCPSMHGH